MGLASLVGLDAGSLGPRFSLVSLLPTSVAVLVVTFVVAAGAPGSAPSWGTAVAAARSMDGGDVALLAVGVLVLAVILQPLQLQLVRLLEGYWGPGRLSRWVAERLTARHEAARTALAARIIVPAEDEPVTADSALADQILRARYPETDLLPTGLGNALRAAERRAGRRYDLDAIVAWPRLYPLIPDRQRAVVEDRRDQLDSAARMCVTLGAVAVITFALLWRFPLWWLLPLGLLVLAALAYRAAVASALAYGETLDVTFDLYRFELISALHLPLPLDNEVERRQNRRVSTWLRQDGPPPAGYQHPE